MDGQGLHLAYSSVEQGSPGFVTAPFQASLMNNVSEFTSEFAILHCIPASQQHLHCEGCRVSDRGLAVSLEMPESSA